MAETLRDLANGTIGEPYRTPMQKAVGTLADLVNQFASAADRIGVRIPEGSPVLPGASLTLRDLTVGDLGRLLEDISYGMYPVTGGNYATGGIGTYGLKPDAMEAANVIPAAALARKGLAKGGKALLSGASGL